MELQLGNAYTIIFFDCILSLFEEELQQFVEDLYVRNIVFLSQF